MDNRLVEKLEISQRLRKGERLSLMQQDNGDALVYLDAERVQ